MIPSKDYHDYIITVFNANWNYVLLSGDTINLQDRSLRVVLNEFHRLCESRQWATIIGQFLRPLRREVMLRAMLSGALLPSYARAGMVCEYSPPRWAYLQPVQDMAALRAAVDAGFRSRASVVAEMGFDVADVDAERAADQQREQDLGILSGDDRLAQAQIELLEAQAAAANAASSASNAQASAAKAAMKQADAMTATAIDTRPLIVAAERARTESARLDVVATQEALEELRGGYDYKHLKAAK